MYNIFKFLHKDKKETIWKIDKIIFSSSYHILLNNFISLF